jgi:lysophospholipase L1-like esterase
MKIIFVGASITQGYWDTEGGWVARVARKYNEQSLKADIFPAAQSFPAVFNLGISGDKADDISERLDTELKARVVNRREDIVVFSFGTNDSQRRGDEFVSSPEKFASDLASVHEIAKNHVDRVIFANILPCDEQRTLPVAWGNSYYYNDRINAFNDAISNFCKDNKLKMIDLHTPLSEANKQQELLIDGLHPNNAGHELISNIVLRELVEIIK